MRTKLNHPVWLFAFAGLCLSAGVFRCAPASAQERPEQLSGTEPVLGTDLFNIRRLGNVIVSPDGREVLYTVTSIVESDEDDVCETSYKDRGGKYQGQRGVTLPKM